jgi:hypothetical protein
LEKVIQMIAKASEPWLRHDRGKGVEMFRKDFQNMYGNRTRPTETSLLSQSCFARVIMIIACSLLLFSISTPSLAQQGTGNIVGSILDPTGAALLDADVTMHNVETGVEFHTKSNSAGAYTFPPVIPGTYEVRAVHAGFKIAIENHVVVQVGGRMEVNLSLPVGATSESVTVMSIPPDLNTTTAGLGVAFDQKPIENLPVNSRAALALAALTPGARSPFGADIQGQGDRGDQVYSISVSGAPAGETAIMIDGINAQLLTQAEVNIDPTVDSLSEFKIESGTLDASFGYTAGGVINMVTKSGTNQYHGTVYEYIRNDAFDAKNYFAAVNARPPEFRYNQYGAAVGGPIMRNRAFFFGNFEQYNYIKGVPSFTSVPTAQERTGDFSDLYTSSGTPIPLYDPLTTVPNPHGSGQVRSRFANNNVSSEIDPVALAYQNTFYPLPNTTPSNPYTHSNNYQGIVRTVNTMRQGMGRVDYKLAVSNSAFVRYWYYEFKTNNPNLLGPVFGRNDDMQNQNLVVGDTHIFSSRVINEFRVGSGMNLAPFTPGGQGQNWPSRLGLPSSIPAQELPSMTNGLPTPLTTLGYRARTRFEAIDTITMTLGNHTLSVGVDYRKSLDSANLGSPLSGSYSFNAAGTGNPQVSASTGSTYASFLIGNVSSTQFSTWIGATDRQNTIAAFAQDNWKALSNLTLNLGIRYDYQQQPYEQNNHYSSFNPNIIDSVNGLQGAYQFAGVGGVGRNFLQENYLNFGPRIGFAWAFGPRQQTVLRGGYSIYYTLQDGTGFAGNQNGFSNTTTYASQSPYQVFHLSSGIPTPPTPPLGAALGPAAFLGQSAVDTHPHAPSPMAQLTSLTLGQALPWGLVAQASFVRNFGYHIPTSAYNENTLNPIYDYQYGLALTDQVPNPYYGIIPASSSIGGPTISRQQSLLPFPYYSSITGNDNHEAWYITHLGEFQVTERNNHGLTVIAGYTVGKTIDVPAIFNSAPVANGLVGITGTGYQNVYNRSADRSLDGSDVSQRLTLSVLYELPIGRGRRFAFRSPALNSLLGGWQINDISIFQKGFPLAITGASNNLATRPNFVPGVSPRLAHRTRYEWFNTAAFMMPPLYTFGNVPRTLKDTRAPGACNFDMSVFKDFALHENMKLSFRAEAFNVFNHPEFGTPNGAFTAGPNGLNSNGTFGTITTTSIDNRELQLALKLLF